MPEEQLERRQLHAKVFLLRLYIKKEPVFPKQKRSRNARQDQDEIARYNTHFSKYSLLHKIQPIGNE